MSCSNSTSGTDYAAHVRDHLQHVAAVGARVEVGAVRRAFRLDHGRALAAIAAQLDADVAVSPAAIYACTLRGHVLLGGAVGVDVDVGRFPALAAQQVVDRHAGQLALDVPQRLVDARDRVVEHRAVAPVAVDHAHLPDFLDATHVPAQ